MLWAKEVVDCLHRVEGADRHLYEDGIPAAHCAIPQPWQLQCQQFLTVFGLMRNEARFLVHKVWQMIRFAFCIARSTDQIYWIEVSGLLHQCRV